MLYVIPFILLLILAIFLKRREDSNQTKNNNKAKKTIKDLDHRKGRATRSIHNAVSASPHQASAIDPALKDKIEKMIGLGDYSSAEHTINQVLNQDNTQHQLYSYLVDIHIAQKDEVAIKHVIHYLRSLNLYEIADRADKKYKSGTASNSTANRTASLSSFEGLADSSVQSNAAFDALIQSKTAQPSASSFDPSQNSSAEPEIHDGLNAIHDVFDAPLTHSSSESISSVAEETVNSPSQALDFSFSESTPTLVAELDASVLAPTPAEPNQKIDIRDHTAFEFSVEAQVEPAQTSNFEAQDFIFKHDFNSSMPTDTQDDAQFDFDLLQVPAPIETKTAQLTEFDFKLDMPMAEQSPALAYENATSQNESLQFESTETAEVDTDPLIASFPELVAIDELDLNLQLAERYIELGAYDSAQLLLSEQQQPFSAEQRQLSEKLLNRIAS